MRFIAAFVAACLAATVCGCAGGPARNQATFVIAQTSEPRSLDPLFISGYTAEEIGSLVYSYLVRIGPHGALEPDLAQRVPTLENGDISRDGRIIVYHLRRNVRWQDGKPFTADDVVATYRAVMDPRNAVPTRLGFDRIERIEALDPRTVRVRLRAPFAPFLTYFFETENYPVLPAHLLTRTSALSGSILDSMPIGTGPFLVVRWRHGQSLELEANPSYFSGTPKLARLRIDFVPSPQTIALRLQTGEAQAYLAADANLLEQLRTNRRIALRIVSIYGVLMLSMQTRDPALRDPNVRRAVAHAFDFARDVPVASHGTLENRDALRGLFTWAYLAQTIPYSRARVPDLTLSIDAGRTLDRSLAVIMQQELRKSNAGLAIRAYSSQQFEATATDAGPLPAGKYQLALHEVLTGADPETAWILACSQIPPAGYNITRFCDSATDRALADALITNDRARRKRDYAIVQTQVARYAPFIGVAEMREIEAIPRTMQGFEPSLETPFYHPERWSL